jgi:23S rRNA (uracil1939-C5)-methyltransferase
MPGIGAGAVRCDRRIAPGGKRFSEAERDGRGEPDCTDSGVDLLLEADGPPGLAALEALAAFAPAGDLARIVWRRRGEDRLVVELRPVRVLFSGIAVPLPPGGFLQASATAERLLVAEVLAGVGSRRPVLDLFAGLGTFACALAQRGSVHAVEGDAAAAALERATVGTARITVERRDLARDPLPPYRLAEYAAVVFDPPRSGAADQPPLSPAPGSARW